MTASRFSSDNPSQSERHALIRQLTHMLNQRAGDRRHFNEQFHRYGVLLEGLYGRGDKAGEQLDALYGEILLMRKDLQSFRQLLLCMDHQFNLASGSDEARSCDGGQLGSIGGPAVR